MESSLSALVLNKAKLSPNIGKLFSKRRSMFLDLIPNHVHAVAEFPEENAARFVEVCDLFEPGAIPNLWVRPNLYPSPPKSPRRKSTSYQTSPEFSPVQLKQKPVPETSQRPFNTPQENLDSPGSLPSKKRRDPHCFPGERWKLQFSAQARSDLLDSLYEICPIGIEEIHPVLKIRHTGFSHSLAVFERTNILDVQLH